MPAIQTLQLIGAVGVLSYAAARLATRTGWFTFHRYALLATPRANLPAIPRGYSVRELNMQSLAAHVIDAGSETQARRFAQELICLGAFDAKARLVGVIWMGAGEHYDEDEVAVRFHFGAGGCWDTGLWIAPEYRLSRAFAALWAGAGAWMAANGAVHSFSRIADYNIGSLLPHRRLGALALGHMLVLRFGRWQWCWRVRPRLMRVDRVPPALCTLVVNGTSN